ncbi:hypothetical protein ID850_14530 [Xenorhabdus sp. Flor]|uniref:hypothetical protein n=1 Tax=Xenorhabdus cabanillasii TaxID=351673 RepID=UPI0019A8A8C5|nr:hypothetical protein [Xenorhabdus sp. Flor]MBD2815952.1 hypothetical protein [Xenorhabdus sp. Flor]
MNKKDYWLESVLDSFFAEERKKQLSKFWSNCEPEPCITEQELDTVDVLPPPHHGSTVVHKASSREQVVKSPRQVRKSGGVTARA